MATVTIILKDARAEDGATTLEMEGRLDPPNAIDDAPPTGAVIVGSYLASHMHLVEQAASAWFIDEMKKAVPAEPETPKIYVPAGRVIT